MSRTTSTAFLDPLIHGFEVVCKKVESLVGGSHASSHGSTRNNPIPGNGHRSAGSYLWADDEGDIPSVPEPASHGRELVNLPAVAEQLAVQYEGIAEERSVCIFVDIAPDALVFGDGATLHWALAQLLAIAIADAPFGGWVVISGAMSHGAVIITLSGHFPSRLPQGTAHLGAVSDRAGHGRASEEIELRPSLVGEILGAHGGHMEMSQWPGEGSRFVIRLPVG